MPNPKSGTITFDLERAIREVKAGRVEFKVDKGGIIHVPFGKASFEPQQLVENLAALVDAINRAKPSAAKGQYFKSLTIASTMGPGIRVDVPSVLASAPSAPRRSRAARDAAIIRSPRVGDARERSRDGSAADSMRGRAVVATERRPSRRTGSRESAGTPTSMPRQESTHLVVGRAPCTWPVRGRGAAPTAARRQRATSTR